MIISYFKHHFSLAKAFFLDTIWMLRDLAQRSWRSFLQINLYKKLFSDEQTLPKEYLATRIYVCSLIITIVIVTTTAAFIDRNVNKIEYLPRSERFQQLVFKYPSNLLCPCSKVGINYDKFVTTDVIFHQVCSSHFIDQSWVDTIFAAQNITLTSSDDFRTRLIFFWQLIAGFCAISKGAWAEVIASFGATRILSQVAVSEDLLRTQVHEDLQNQITFSQSTLALNLHSIRQMIHGNQMVSGLATNFYLRYSLVNRNYSWVTPKMSAQVYNGCSCLNTAGCPHPATFNDSHDHLVTVPGMVADCWILDGTLASTLECYYNQTCLSLLHGSLGMRMIPFSNDLNKRFIMTSTIEMLLNEIMVDSMTDAIRFELYYAQCNPTYCAYSYTHRFDILFVVTTIFGIFGGLSLILKLIAPVISAMILRRKNLVVSNNATPIHPNRRKSEFNFSSDVL